MKLVALVQDPKAVARCRPIPAHVSRAHDERVAFPAFDLSGYGVICPPSSRSLPHPRSGSATPRSNRKPPPCPYSRRRTRRFFCHRHRPRTAGFLRRSAECRARTRGKAREPWAAEEVAARTLARAAARRRRRRGGRQGRSFACADGSMFFRRTGGNVGKPGWTPRQRETPALEVYGARRSSSFAGTSTAARVGVVDAPRHLSTESSRAAGWSS